MSLGEDRDAIAAFLFTWRDGDFSRRPIKLPKASSQGRLSHPWPQRWRGASSHCEPLLLSVCVRVHLVPLDWSSPTPTLSICSQVGGAALAVVKDQPSSGIHFGPDGLAIPLAPGSERLAKCKVRMPDGRCTEGGRCKGGMALFWLLPPAAWQDGAWRASRLCYRTQLCLLRSSLHSRHLSPSFVPMLHNPLPPTQLGPYYARLPDGGKSLFAAGESGRGTLLAGLRVYLAEGGPEQWELDGIVWKTKRS